VVRAPSPRIAIRGLSSTRERAGVLLQASRIIRVMRSLEVIVDRRRGVGGGGVGWRGGGGGGGDGVDLFGCRRGSGHSWAEKQRVRGWWTVGPRNSTRGFDLGLWEVDR